MSSCSGYPAVLIHRQQADIDRFDDRFVELFKKRKLFGMLLAVPGKACCSRSRRRYSRKRSAGSQDLRTTAASHRWPRPRPITATILTADDARDEVMQLLSLRRCPCCDRSFRQVSASLCFKLVGPDNSLFRRFFADHQPEIRRDIECLAQADRFGDAVMARRTLVLDKDRDLFHIEHLSTSLAAKESSSGSSAVVAESVRPKSSSPWRRS